MGRAGGWASVIQTSGGRRCCLRTGGVELRVWAEARQRRTNWAAAAADVHPASAPAMANNLENKSESVSRLQLDSQRPCELLTQPPARPPSRPNKLAPGGRAPLQAGGGCRAPMLFGACVSAWEGAGPGRGGSGKVNRRPGSSSSQRRVLARARSHLKLDGASPHFFSQTAASIEISARHFLAWP